MMRILRGLLALALLLASLVAVPWLLLELGHYPAAGDLSWTRLFLTPDDGRVLLWVVTALGWVVWLLFTVSTALDVAALLGRPRIHLPGLRWMQGVSGALLVAVLVMLGTHDDPGSTDHRTGLGVVATAYAAPVPPVEVEPVARTAVADTANATVDEPDDWVEHTVVRGDDLWTLAETHLGDGMEWRQIVELNPERLAHDPEHLEPGWVLRIPAPPAPTVQAAPAPPVTPPAVAPPSVAPSLSTQVLATPTPIPAPVPDKQLPDRADAGVSEHTGLLAGTGAAVAAGVTALLAARRRRQVLQSPIGTVPRPAPAAAERLRSALASTPLPPALGLVEWAVHMVARDALQRGALADLDWVRAGPSGIEFRWAQAGSATQPAPPSFTSSGTSWSIGLADVLADRDAAPDDTPSRLWPTLVTVGSDGDDTYLADLERWGRISVQTDSAERAGEILTSYLMELVTAPWAGGARVTVVGDDGGFVEVGESEDVVRVATLGEILPTWESRAATQQSLAALADGPLPLLRLDPDFAEAWAPQVLVLLADITPAERARLTARFSRSVRGPLVLLSEHPGGDACLVVDESPLRAVWEPTGVALTPHLVPATVRDAVVELARARAPHAVVPAPWWGASPDTTAPEELPMSDAPRLLLLGPVVLEGARGTPPSRAPRQCLEYCAWLLEHPNASSVEMARSLLIAEPTRRSNMSRLRGWLGTDDADVPYLPEAYSGRIRLQSSVRSDWQEVQILLGRGVELASDATLVAILELVRGAPLADAPPGGWTWAEELRITASMALRDVAYALSERALENDDLDLAKWAVGRGLVAAQGDETLLRQLLVCEGRSGNRDDVERLVFALNAQARSLGVDLLPETVVTMQQVMEGRIRAREMPRPSRAAV